MSAAHAHFALWLGAVWLLTGLATGCGGDDDASAADAGSEESRALVVGLDESLAATNASASAFCACATQPSSSFCRQVPSQCFPYLEACLDQQDGDYTAARRGCFLAAYGQAAEASVRQLECTRDVDRAWLSCLERVEACDSDGVIRCGDERDAASDACPPLTGSVIYALRECAR